MRRVLAILIINLLGIDGFSYRVSSCIDSLRPSAHVIPTEERGSVSMDGWSRNDIHDEASISMPSYAKDSLVRSTKSYLIVDYNPKDTTFLKEKCRQAGLDMGISVWANRIPTDSKLVTPRPSEHLLKQGILHLQLPMDEHQDEFAVYHSDLFDTPSNINVLQIEDELITYRTMETTGNIHLLYHCVRGAFGTKAKAHSKDAPVYKLWDTPERTLLPDLELQDQMAQAIAQELAQTDYSILIFNDLKSYSYNKQGDTAISHFFDTIRKYNPDKLLQADLLTPASWYHLSRVNENQLWNESMRTKMEETLTEKLMFYDFCMVPCMLGNFQIILADKNRKATTLEELEWFLSKTAAYNTGFGLEFSEKAMRTHGLTEEMLNTIRIWEMLRLNGAFSEAQKEELKDPYGNWHLEQADDTTYLLYPQHISRRYFYNFTDDSWEWNNPYPGQFALQIAMEGKGSVSELEFRTENGILLFPCTLKAGQYLFYSFDGTARITDLNYNTLEEFIPYGTSFLPEGLSKVFFRCTVQHEGKKQPEVTVRFLTRGKAETLLE